MSKAIALIVYLVDIDHNSSGYEGWTGLDPLPGTEQDFKQMRDLLGHQKFVLNWLPDKLATAERVLAALEKITKSLEPGDIFVFYFSGHGIQLDHPGRTDKPGFDDAICCFNRPVLDLELGKIWEKVKPGVRLVMISNSCHSGNNAAFRISLADTIKKNISTSAYPDVKAMLIHYGACKDDQNAPADLDGSPFTKTLVSIYDNGKFKGNYRKLLDEISKAYSIPNVHEAQYNELGPKLSIAFKKFREQKPFTTQFSNEFLLHSNSTIEQSPTSETQTKPLTQSIFFAPQNINRKLLQPPKEDVQTEQLFRSKL